MVLPTTVRVSARRGVTVRQQTGNRHGDPGLGADVGLGARDNGTEQQSQIPGSAAEFYIVRSRIGVAAPF